VTDLKRLADLKRKMDEMDELGKWLKNNAYGKLLLLKNQRKAASIEVRYCLGEDTSGFGYLLNSEENTCRQTQQAN
jgi:hypothetical protein